MKQTKLKITELLPDDKNFNKGSEFGQGLIEKSFQQFGAGRSILLDKNNKIIAGNKSTENYGATGGEDIIVIESDGKQLIAVKRTDIDLDTPQGREMALADNATAKANIVWAEDVIASELGVEVAESWGVVAHSMPDIDYSILDDEDIEDQLKEMTDGVKKAIQIEFNAEHYEKAYELVKFWREQKAYVGGMIMEYLKAEKDKL
jgi:hypothetical protein